MNRTEIFIPMMNENLESYKNELSMTSLGLSGTYSLFENRVRLSSGSDYMTHGDDDSAVKIIGGKIGCEWDIFNSLVLNAKGNIRFTHAPENKNDEIDNDNDGKVDNTGEEWSTNSSGLMISLGYRF